MCWLRGAPATSRGLLTSRSRGRTRNGHTIHNKDASLGSSWEPYVMPLSLQEVCAVLTEQRLAEGRVTSSFHRSVNSLEWVRFFKQRNRKKTNILLWWRNVFTSPTLTVSALFFSRCFAYCLCIESLHWCGSEVDIVFMWSNNHPEKISD